MLENSKDNPLYVFTKIFGVGPKKAHSLVNDDNIKTMEELCDRQDEVLNNVQIKGLRYYEDILKRIPRDEIDAYQKIVARYFDTLPKTEYASFNIVGSYRRRAQNSGDIDIIVTDITDNIFNVLIDVLVK